MEEAAFEDVVGEVGEVKVDLELGVSVGVGVGVGINTVDWLAVAAIVVALANEGKDTVDIGNANEIADPDKVCVETDESSRTCPTRHSPLVGAVKKHCMPPTNSVVLVFVTIGTPGRDQP